MALPVALEARDIVVHPPVFGAGVHRIEALRFMDLLICVAGHMDRGKDPRELSAGSL